MKKVLKKGKRSNKIERLVAYEQILNQAQGASRIELIQLLIPLGLQAIAVEIQADVDNVQYLSHI